jgi:hypothetical protein
LPSLKIDFLFNSPTQISFCALYFSLLLFITQLAFEIHPFWGRIIAFLEEGRSEGSRNESIQEFSGEKGGWKEERDKGEIRAMGWVN